MNIRFDIELLQYKHVRFALLDLQFNINLLRFASIFKFFNINMFASLRNKFSNYRTSSLRFDIEKKRYYRSFRSLRFDIYGDFSFKSSIADSPYQQCGESATLRIFDTVSRQIFYLMLIFSDFAADHGLINYIETKAKGCHLKNFTCKGTLRQVFIRVYRLEIHFTHMLVFLTQLCKLLTLKSSLWFNSSPLHPLPLCE